MTTTRSTQITSWGGNRKRRSQQCHTPAEIPADLVEPCKVYVSNLRRAVTERVLFDAMAHYAEVEQAIVIKDKHTKRSKGYGFVKVKSNEDVNKLLALRDCERYIQGQPVVIRVAKKRICLPGEEGYVRRPLSDRDFDLTSPDFRKPSIHMLVDDVMFKIFSYLPIRSLVKCEGVCRRWQVLLHCHFSKMINLEISEESLGISPPFTKAIVSKLLILCGPNLKWLKVQKIDFATRQNILKIIAQLCPELEYLDVTRARGINFQHISKLSQGCKNIKGFIAKNCIDFDEKALHQLLVSYPELEKLDVSGTSVYGKNFNILPSTLKELYIERIPDMCHKRNTATQIADRCPNIEVLEMKECMLSIKDLEYFGKNCRNLTQLAVYMPLTDSTSALANFKKLKDLTLVGDIVDLTELFTNLPQLEVLTVDTRDITCEDVDFSILQALKSLKLFQTSLTTSSMKSIGKCRKLESIYMYKWHSLPEEVLIEILKGCPKLKHVTCPSLQLEMSLISKVDQIMKNRPGKVVIEARDVDNVVKKTQYDKTKIEFDTTCNISYLYNPFGYDSDESDYSDVSFDGGWYDSDVDFPEQYFFDDHDFRDDLLEAAVMLAAWNEPTGDLY